MGASVQTSLHPLLELCWPGECHLLQICSKKFSSDQVLPGMVSLGREEISFLRICFMKFIEAL